MSGIRVILPLDIQLSKQAFLFVVEIDYVNRTSLQIIYKRLSFMRKTIVQTRHSMPESTLANVNKILAN